MLRQRVVLCEFTDLDGRIRDQFVEKWYSQKLRRKLIEQQNLNLNKVREIVQTMELSQIQTESLEHLGIKQEVNTVCAKPKSNNKKLDDGHQKKNCFACGLFGHFKSDPKCPARGKKCRKCSKVEYFEKCCKSKDERKKSRFKKRKVHTVEEERQLEESDHEYVFSVKQKSQNPTAVNLTVGGIPVTMMF